MTFLVNIVGGKGSGRLQKSAVIVEADVDRLASTTGQRVHQHSLTVPLYY